MGRLTLSVLALLVIFATSMSFIVLGVYNDDWISSVIGVAILLVFFALGGLVIPKTKAALPQERQRSANALVQTLGAFCLLLFLIMALVAWGLGNRSVSGNGYQVIGLLIFLGLIGLGVPGAIFTLGMFAYLFDQENKAGARRPSVPHEPLTHPA